MNIINLISADPYTRPSNVDGVDYPTLYFGALALCLESPGERTNLFRHTNNPAKARDKVFLSGRSFKPSFVAFVGLVAAWVHRHDLEDLLLETQGQHLRFDGGDSVLGTGDDGQGLNMLGEALMAVRQQLIDTITPAVKPQKAGGRGGKRDRVGFRPVEVEVEAEPANGDSADSGLELVSPIHPDPVDRPEGRDREVLGASEPATS